ncbi:hypothetical protein CBL_10522 [Carabus blaptoides fortunei]
MDVLRASSTWRISQRETVRCAVEAGFKPLTTVPPKERANRRGRAGARDEERSSEPAGGLNEGLVNLHLGIVERMSVPTSSRNECCFAFPGPKITYYVSGEHFDAGSPSLVWKRAANEKWMSPPSSILEPLVLIVLRTVLSTTEYSTLNFFAMQ